VMMFVKQVGDMMYAYNDNDILESV
jgi:hypothetical protein